MREIKFRFWYPKGKKMSTPSDKYGGDVFIRANGEQIICIDTGEWEEGYRVDFVKDNLNLIPMQYSGLKDSASKEVYEGDVLKPLNGGHLIIQGWMNDGQWYAPEDWCKKCKIIGNVFENPELIK